MIQSLKLGDRVFPHNLIQGPLAGISCAPFRRLAWEQSEPAFSCTEMISCKTLINKPVYAQQRFLRKDPHEGPVCFQLSGNNPDEVAQATKIATDHGADLIDLNCGCPVKKIRVRGAGSRLLTNPNLLYKLICAMKNNTKVPISVKIRVEGQSGDSFHDELAKVITEAGADYLIVHGRHWTEHYETACNYEHIRYFVNAMKIPVIGNGDIACVDSLKKMFATGCAGVMIGRAGVGQPWLIRKLMAEYHQDNFSEPHLTTKGKMFLQHVTELMALINNEKFSILQARKFAKYYARSMPNKLVFIEQVNQCETFPALNAICQQYFI